MADNDGETFRRVPLEVFNQGRVDVIDELFAEGFVEHLPIPPGYPSNHREALKVWIQDFRRAFPDLNLTIVQQLRDGDRHIGHIRASGTMTGDFLGMPATGKHATWEELHIGRISGGKIVEHWGVIDQLGMMQQLGLAPAPPGA